MKQFKGSPAALLEGFEALLQLCSYRGSLHQAVQVAVQVWGEHVQVEGIDVSLQEVDDLLNPAGQRAQGSCQGSHPADPSPEAARDFLSGVTGHNGNYSAQQQLPRGFAALTQPQQLPVGLPKALTLGWKFNCSLKGTQEGDQPTGHTTPHPPLFSEELSVRAWSCQRTVLGPPKALLEDVTPQNVPYPESCLILLGFVSSLLAVRMMLRYLRS